MGRVQPRRGLEGFEPAVVQRGDQLASAVRRVVHLPESFEEGDDRGDAPSEHHRVLAPLDLEGPALVLADGLEPRPSLVERPPDQAGVAVDVRQLRIGICGELEQPIEGAAAERLDLRARVAQEPHERVRVGAGRGRRHADSTPLARVEEERHREVCAGPRQEVEVRGRRSLVEPVDRFVECSCVLRRGRRFRDFLEALDLRLQLPDPGFDGAVCLPVAGLESSDFRALLGDPVESPPGFPRPIEIATPGFPQGRIEPGHQARRETFLLRRLPEVGGDRLDVPGEDAHLAPVVHLTLPEEAVDPLAVPVQRAVEDAGDSLDLLARPTDRFEELGGLRFEGICRRRVAGRHESHAMEPRAYLGSFGRSRNPLPPPFHISPDDHRGSVGIVQDIGHLLLPVDDMDKALAFYRDLLGFRVVGKGSPIWTVIETKGGQLTLWRTSEIPKVALGPKADSSPFEFHVDNFERASLDLESKGIRVRRNGAHAGTIWDPFGNVLRLHDHLE